MKRLLLAGLLALLCSCTAATTASLTGEVSYAQDPAQDFLRGKQALEDGRHLDAIKYFEHVRSRFPYSQQAALADLAIADAHFDREKFPDAVDAYREFLKLHPSHEQADYAQFRIGLSNYRDMPSSFFLFPPPTQKDQAPVKRARASMEEFLRIFPKSQYAPEAREKADELRRRMAEHELYVADFYLHREKHRAVVGRLERLLQEFPGLGYEGKALLQLGRSYLQLDEKDKARAALQRLIAEFPQDPNRATAESLLKSQASLAAAPAPSPT